MILLLPAHGQPFRPFFQGLDKNCFRNLQIESEIQNMVVMNTLVEEPTLDVAIQYLFGMFWIFAVLEIVQDHKHCKHNTKPNRDNLLTSVPVERGSLFSTARCLFLETHRKLLGSSGMDLAQ